MNDCYEIKLDFEKDNSAINIFNTLLELNQGLDEYNKTIIGCISNDIGITSVVLDIDRGSIKVKLSDMIKKFPVNGSIERFVGKSTEVIKENIREILIKGKDKLFDIAELDLSQIEKEEFLFTEIKEIIINSELSSYGASVSKEKIIKSAEGVFKPIRNSSNDIYVSSNGHDFKKINKNFEVTLEETFKENIKENIFDAKITIKKPVFIGNSKWELIYENKSLDVEILDENFIKRIKNREIAIMAGDLLDCKFKSKIMYNDNNEVVESKYYVLFVFDVIPPPEENKLDIY